MENGEKGFCQVTANMLGVQSEGDLAEIKGMSDIMEWSAAGKGESGEVGKEEVL